MAAAYRRLAALQMETLQRRASAGTGDDPAPLETIAAALEQAVAEKRYPGEAAELFRDLRRRLSAEAGPKRTDADLTRVIERIQALRAKTVEQGCTEQEALAAANKMAELLDRYGLSLSEIELRRQPCQGIGIDTERRRHGPLDRCVPAIATFCDCKVWTEKTATGTIRYVFFGLPADVEAAHYLYDLVTFAFDTETASFKSGAIYAEMAGGHRRTAVNSFQIGLSRGLSAKLDALKAERAAQKSTGRDLVPLKTSIIDEELAKLGLSFHAQGQKRGRRVLAEAYEAGHVAGRKFEVRAGLQ